MTPYYLYLAGSIILTGASVAAFLDRPTGVNLAYIVASLMFCLGGIAGLLGL